MRENRMYKAKIDTNIEIDRNGEWINGYYDKMVIGGNERHYIHIYDDKRIRVDPKTISKDLYIANRDQEYLFENQTVLFKGKEYIVCFEGWRCTIERNLRTHGENEIIVIDEAVALECKITGNIFDKKESPNE